MGLGQLILMDPFTTCPCTRGWYARDVAGGHYVPGTAPLVQMAAAASLLYSRASVGKRRLTLCWSLTVVLKGYNMSPSSTINMHIHTETTPVNHTRPGPKTRLLIIPQQRFCALNNNAYRDTKQITLQYVEQKRS